MESPVSGDFCGVRVELALHRPVGSAGSEAVLVNRDGEVVGVQIEADDMFPRQAARRRDACHRAGTQPQDGGGGAVDVGLGGARW